MATAEAQAQAEAEAAAAKAAKAAAAAKAKAEKESKMQKQLEQGQQEQRQELLPRREKRGARGGNKGPAVAVGTGVVGEDVQGGGKGSGAGRVGKSGG